MALDLTRDVPRSPFDELAGFAWLPRMIDKARAGFAGTLGEYSVYPCAGDRAFLGHYRLDAAALGTMIRDGASDGAIAAYVMDHARGDHAAFKARLTEPYGNPFRRLALFAFRTMVARRSATTHPGVDWGRHHTFARVIAAEEGHPPPSR